MSAQECPHKDGTKAAKAWAESRARLAAIEAARSDVEQLSALPSGWGDWCAIRTRAWRVALDEAKRQAGLSRPRVQNVSESVRLVKEIASGAISISECAKVAFVEDAES